jgi:16S rRNA (uracil1498-N3)-methyltransferase
MGNAGIRTMTRAPRFAVAGAPQPGDVVRISGTEAHHMRRVMRLGTGAAITLIDERGAEHTATIERFDRSGAEARILATAAVRARPDLIIAPAIIKGPRMDLIVEKAAELGATELWPVICARGLVREPGAARLARWRRLALGASKQSLVAPPMSVAEPVAFADLIRRAPRDTLALICAQGAEPMHRILERKRPAAILIACGPEGDFTPEEARAAAEAGFAASGLGSGRLRSETAAIAALAIAGEWLAAAPA